MSDVFQEFSLQANELLAADDETKGIGSGCDNDCKDKECRNGGLRCIQLFDLHTEDAGGESKRDEEEGQLGELGHAFGFCDATFAFHNG